MVSYYLDSQAPSGEEPGQRSFYFYQERERGLPGGATPLFMSEIWKDAQCTWEKAFAVKGISEENFKPSEVNRCLVFWLLTLEKPLSNQGMQRGHGGGENARVWNLDRQWDPAHLGTGNNWFFRLEVLGEKALLPSSVISASSSPN